MKISDFIAAGFSSFLMILAFPAFNFWPLIWVGMIPLFIAVQNKTPLQSFWIGWCQGILFYLGTLSWLTSTIVNYGKIPELVSVFVLLLLSVYLGAYSGLFCYFLTCFKRNNIQNWFVAPFLWVSLEYIRAHLLTGFPWASLAYSQFKFIYIIQMADITGIYGISFLIVFVNVSLFLLLDYFYFFQPKKIKTVALRNNLVTSVLLILMCLGYGYWEYSCFSSQTRDKSLKIALIQGNIEQDLKWDILYQEEVYETYKNLTLEAAGESTDLIIWPETATPFYFQTDRENRKKLLQLGRESQSYILFGSPRYLSKKEGLTLFNSAFLISPEKKILGQYDKMHLVPFGEYVPLKKFLFFVEKMVSGIGDFGRGTEYSVFSLPEWQFAVLICFEAIFPDQVRRFVKAGADFLVNITNDAWFGKSAAPYQHIAMVVFRAVENRRPVVRAANSGITGIINNRGEIIRQTEIFVQDKVIGNIFPEKKYKTVYTRYGDIFAISLLFYTLVYGVYSYKQKTFKPVQKEVSSFSD